LQKQNYRYVVIRGLQLFTQAKYSMCMSNEKKLSLLLSGVAVTYKGGRHIGMERFFYI